MSKLVACPGITPPSYYPILCTPPYKFPEAVGTRQSHVQKNQIVQASEIGRDSATQLVHLEAPGTIAHLDKIVRGNRSIDISKLGSCLAMTPPSHRFTMLCSYHQPSPIQLGHNNYTYKIDNLLRLPRLAGIVPLSRLWSSCLTPSHTQSDRKVST